MTIKDKQARVAIVAAAAAMEAAILNVGTAGNVSTRLGTSMLITPIGVPCEMMRPEMIAAMPINGEYGAWAGPLKPSTEWRVHLDIMRARPDVGAIVHFHPTFCTALSMLNKPLLAAHYMIAMFGGSVVKCTKYAPFGTKELADLVVEGLGDRHAVLLGNHGALTTGADLPSAMRRARELENLARMYYYSICAGRPAILADEEVMRIVERFKTYGVAPEAPKRAAAPKKRARSKAKTKAAGPKKAAPRKKKTRATA
jgi:L-fuculose-phosphate aldolase